MSARARGGLASAAGLLLLASRCGPTSRPAAGELTFADATTEVGLAAPPAGMMGHVPAWGDSDRDGDLDLFVAGCGDRPSETYAPALGPVASRLPRQETDGRFVPVAGPASEIVARAAAAPLRRLFREPASDRRVEVHGG